MAFVKLLRGKSKAQQSNTPDSGHVEPPSSPCQWMDLGNSGPDTSPPPSSSSCSPPASSELSNSSISSPTSGPVSKRRFPVSIKSFLEGGLRHLHQHNSLPSAIPGGSASSSSKRDKFQHIRKVATTEEDRKKKESLQRHCMVAHQHHRSHDSTSHNSLNCSNLQPVSRSMGVCMKLTATTHSVAVTDANHEDDPPLHQTSTEIRRRNRSAGAVANSSIQVQQQQLLSVSAGNPQSVAKLMNMSLNLDSPHTSINNKEVIIEDNYEDPLRTSLSSPSSVSPSSGEFGQPMSTSVTGLGQPFPITCEEDATLLKHNNNNNNNDRPKDDDLLKKTASDSSLSWDRSFYSSPCRVRVPEVATSGDSELQVENEAVPATDTLRAQDDGEVVRTSVSVESDVQTTKSCNNNIVTTTSTEIINNNNNDNKPLLDTPPPPPPPLPSKHVLTKEPEFEEPLLYDEAWDVKMNRRMGLPLRSLTTAPAASFIGKEGNPETIASSSPPNVSTASPPGPHSKDMYDYAYNRIWQQNKQMNFSSNVRTLATSPPTESQTDTVSVPSSLPPQYQWLPYMDQQSTGGSVSMPSGGSSPPQLTLCITCNQVHEPTSQTGPFLCVPVPSVSSLSSSSSQQTALPVPPPHPPRVLAPRKSRDSTASSSTSNPPTPLLPTPPRPPPKMTSLNVPDGANDQLLSTGTGTGTGNGSGTGGTFGYMESASMDEAISRYQNGANNASSANSSVSISTSPYATDPLLVTGNRRAVCTGCHINEKVPLQQQKWYHANMSRLQAETVLATCPEGSFLVRDSASFRNEYSLSIRCAGLPFLHMRIGTVTTTQHESNTAPQYVIGEHSQPFPSVVALIHHYTHRPLPIKDAKCVVLRLPVGMEPLATSF